MPFCALRAEKHDFPIDDDSAIPGWVLVSEGRLIQAESARRTHVRFGDVVAEQPGSDCRLLEFADRHNFPEICPIVFSIEGPRRKFWHALAHGTWGLLDL